MEFIFGGPMFRVCCFISVYLRLVDSPGSGPFSKMSTPPYFFVWLMVLLLMVQKSG